MGGVCSIATDFKILKMLFSFSIFKKKQIRGEAFSYHNAVAKYSIRSDDSIIYSTTSPLHHFYYMHFASVSNYDLNPAVSVRFIDSTTLPLHGDPIHNVCDIPLAPWKLADWGIISTITYRKIES
jgi:hypothetical protein